MSPTISTKKAETKRSFTSRQSLEREELIFYIACGVSAATIILHLVIHLVVSNSAAAARERRIAAVESAQVLELGEADFKTARMRELGERVKNGDPAAADARAAEFEARVSLDPKYARSPREKAMLEMRELAGDTVDPGSLEKICLLAPPLGSVPKPLAKVTAGETGYNVEIAYPCTAALGESLVGQSPRAFYREVVRTTAGVVRDVMAVGDGRGVNQLLVTCWSEVTVGDAGSNGSKKEVRHQFVVTAEAGGRDWARMSRADVEKVWKKKKDELRQLLLERKPN